MKYTKADILLDLVAFLEEQEDVTIVNKISRETGIDFMNEQDFSEEALQCIGELDLTNAYQSAKDFIAPHLATVGQKVASGVTSGAQHLSNLAQTHPAAVGAGALALGAAAALRMRQNMKARLQAKQMTPHE